VKYLGPKRKPKYARQLDDFSCGPVAVLNALKWVGYDANYKRDHKRLVKLCRCTKDGTHDEGFDRAIRNYKHLLVYPRKYPKYRASIHLLDVCLEDGGAVAMGFIYKHDGVVVAEHFTLCIGKRKNGYVFVNNTRKCYKKTITIQRRRTVVRMLRFSDDGSGCSVWFLHKRKA
jgi:hypothetical protein